jgi:CheY-like chemotaxis protein
MEAVGHLAGGIAHDFNNILTGIIGYATIVSGKIKEDGHLKPFLKQILDLADRAANLTHSLLAFSRKQVLDPKPLSIMDIVSGMQRILERIIGEDIRIRVLAGSDDLIVRADKSQVEQVLMNLATNARDAMPHGGQLTITIEEVEIDSHFIQTQQYGEAGRYVVISFADTGVGMDSETKGRMFEPFFTTKEVGKGTGLGLAMVYGTIKQHTGFIEVQSEPGEGTTFKIYLPSAGPALAQPAEKKKPAVLSGTETVLLVEDDDAVRKVSRAMLEDLGYRVIEAIDGDDAIRLFAEYKDAVDLVLSDIIMPKQTGIDVQNELKKIKPDIKVLFVSGYTADTLTQKGFIETGISFIPKPLRLDSLSKKIREVLDE